MPISTNEFNAAAPRKLRSEAGATLSEILAWAALILATLFWGTTVLGITIALADRRTGAWWVVLIFGALPFFALYRVADRLLHRGNGPEQPAQTDPAARDPVAPSDAPVPTVVEDLTARELEVLMLLEKGRTNGEIASELFVSPATVKSHVNAILRKLGARNRTEAVAQARRLNLI